MGDMSDVYEEEVKELYQLPKLFSNESEWKDFIFYILKSRSIDVIFLAGSTYGYELLPEIKACFPHIKVVNPVYLPFGQIDNNRKFYRYIDLSILENKSLEHVMDWAIPSKQKIIHNGVNIDEFKPNPEDLVPKINDNKFVISFIGRFAQQKRPDIFLNIIIRLQQYENLSFIMAGDGDLYPEILRLIQQFQLENRVSLPSFVDAKKYLSMSNLLILPSEQEGRPNIVLESLAMGVPVIASSVGGLPEIIEDAYNGFLCKFGDVDDFVLRIKEVLNNQELYLNMRRNARRYAVSHLDINIMHQNYLDTFQSLVESKKEE
jgi:glycosyltransferase involved in cell wall biosynthesis